jgi:hypothetical protein
MLMAGAFLVEGMPMEDSLVLFIGFSTVRVDLLAPLRESGPSLLTRPMLPSPAVEELGIVPPSSVRACCSAGFTVPGRGSTALSEVSKFIIKMAMKMLRNR